MATATFNLRPFVTAPDLSWFRRISWYWWLMRLPMALLAIPAAYGVGGFSHEHLPLIVSIIAGMGFEASYMGAIAMADQQHDKDDPWSTRLWWAVNVGAVAASIICNLLFVSGYRFANVAWESWVHAAPLPLVNFLYGLMLHRMAAKAAFKAKITQEAQQALADETRFKCPWCGTGRASIPAVRGHQRHCAHRPIKTS